MAPRDDGPWGVREIAKGVDMNPSTVHRLLGLLEEEGLVRQDDPGGGYRLGTELLRLAWTASGAHSVHSAALPHMQELAEASGETVTFGLFDPVRLQTYVLAVVESDAPFRYVSTLHEWRDLYTGASGRAVMAFLPDDQRRAVVERTRLVAGDRAHDHEPGRARERPRSRTGARLRVQPGGAPAGGRRHRRAGVRAGRPDRRRGRGERPRAAVPGRRRGAARTARDDVRPADHRGDRRLTRVRRWCILQRDIMFS